MSETKEKTWPITARGRSFSEDEARLFNQAVSLLETHGKQEVEVASGRELIKLGNADIAPFTITRTTVTDGRDRKIEIGVIYEGKVVLQAFREQWKRPKRRRELAALCHVPTFIRGEWEAALLQLR